MITLTLTEEEYRQLLKRNLLATLVEDIYEKSHAARLADADLYFKLCELGYLSKSKSVQKHSDGVYGIVQDIEDEMLATFEDFKKGVRSGFFD